MNGAFAVAELVELCRVTLVPPLVVYLLVSQER